ncbi:MAG: chaperone modulator CbpM [Thiotrichaceae bacterium]
MNTPSIKTPSIKVLSGHILEETESLSMAELCKNCHQPAEAMIKLIEQGIISPCSPYRQQTISEWRFHSSSLIRADKAMRIKRDLGVNLAGIALVLELLDEISELKTTLYRVRTAPHQVERR